MGFKQEGEAESYERTKDKLLTEVKRVFRPEFINRLDEIIVFHSLDKPQMEKIVDIQLIDIEERLKEKKITLHLSKAAKELLVEQGFDPLFGARPIKRALRRLLEDPLAEEILRNRFKEGSVINIDRDQEQLSFTEEHKVEEPSIAQEPKTK